MQSSYVISKSLMYFGNYNLYANISSAFNKKTICVSNNDYVETFKPYWGQENCEILSPKTDLKPSLLTEEYPKSINEISPEEIACSILNSLDIKHDLDKVSTIFTGEEYKKSIIDLVPSPFDVQSMNITGAVNIRMD